MAPLRISVVFALVAWGPPLALSAPPNRPPETQEGALVKELWSDIGEYAHSSGRPAPPPLVLDPTLSSPEPFLEPRPNGSHAVRVSLDTVKCLRLIATANVYINYLASKDLYKPTALNDYATTLAMRLATAERLETSLHPVDVAEFFHISPQKLQPISTNPALSNELRGEFQLLTLSLLTHEYAHFALRQREGFKESVVSEEAQADAYARKLTAELYDHPVPGLGITTAFFLTYLKYEPGPFKGRVPELCHRMIDNAIVEGKLLLDRLQHDPAFAEQVKPQIPALKSAIEQMNHEHAGCDQYAGS